jgi:hypothetical protein
MEQVNRLRAIRETEPQSIQIPFPTPIFFALDCESFSFAFLDGSPDGNEAACPLATVELLGFAQRGYSQHCRRAR